VFEKISHLTLGLLKKTQMTTRQQYVKSKYQCVAGVMTKGVIKWRVNMAGVGRVNLDSERECAIAVDKIKISQGKNPVNILKRVKQESINKEKTL
jgi:hypothetical protein